MDDQWTRNNRIARLSLEQNLNTPYLSVLSVVGVLFIFVFSEPNFSIASRVILYVFLGFIAALLYWDYQNKKSEIKDIFEH